MKISQTADGFAKLNLSSMDYYFDVLNKCILLRFYRTPKKHNNVCFSYDSCVN